MPHERGFTLIETIVALMVVAAATVMLMQIYSSVSTAGAKSANILRAVEIARDQLEQMGNVVPLEAGDQRGVTSDGFLWQLRVEPYGGEADGGEIVLMQVNAVVQKISQREILANLTTLKLVREGEK